MGGTGLGGFLFFDIESILRCATSGAWAMPRCFLPIRTRARCRQASA
jgi:hypothetical protein